MASPAGQLQTVASATVSVPKTEAKAATKPQKKVISPGISLLSGAVAGAVEATITYPFEFAKTRAQLSREGVASGPVSKNPFAVISYTAKHDGLRSIYTGCSTLIVGTAAKAGVRFLSFDAIRNVLADSNGKLSPARGVLAGMVAGAVESIAVVTPTERLKTALIDDARSPARRFNGGFHALRLILAERGVVDLYRGLLSTILKQSATSAVRMGSYNVLREAATSRLGPERAKSTAVTFATGAAAGVVTVYASQPFDTIKTRAQGAKGATTAEAVKDVWRSGGLKAFWSGSSMRLGRLVLSGGIVFTVYEQVSSMLSGSSR